MPLKKYVPQILVKYLSIEPMLDAWIQWALNPTSFSAGYGIEENYSFIRSNLMERYLISADEAEEYVRALRNEASVLISSGYDIYDIRKSVLEEAKLSDIIKQKIGQSSIEVKKALYLLAYLNAKGFFRYFEQPSFDMNNWVQFLKKFSALFEATYGKSFSKQIGEELFKAGLWNKLWYKPCRSPGKVQIVMMGFPPLQDFDFNEEMAHITNVKQFIEQSLSDRKFEQIAFIDEIINSPFGLLGSKEDMPSILGIPKLIEKEGYVAISPFVIEDLKTALNFCKQEIIRNFDEKIDRALKQLCDENWPNCQLICKTKGQQSLWRLDSANFSPLFIYLTPWLTKADINLLFSEKEMNAVFIVLTQSIPVMKHILFEKIDAFRYLEILIPSMSGFECWKAKGERFGYSDKIVDLISEKSAHNEELKHNNILRRIEYYSCFISYGEPDVKFAKRLSKDLETSGVKCWLYSLNSTPGKKVWTEIKQKMAEADKSIILCSAKSLIREGLLKEIEEQIDLNSDKIIPISLDNLWKQNGFPVKRGNFDLKPLLLEKNYVDFQNRFKYYDSLAKLLSSLQRK